MTAEQRRVWDERGFLILPSFLSKETIEIVLGLHETVWRDRPSDIIVDNLVEGGRKRLDQVPEGGERQAHKINDLYLSFPEIRHCALDQRLVPLMAELLGDAPALCNTLSLDYGTEQAAHVDSLYMTPPGESALVATWAALEDCHPDAGPLVYVPGSHKIPPYRFSDGRMTESAAEHEDWEAYTRKQVALLGLVEEQFLPRQGDLLIWHGQLLHGGGKRNDPARTRRSLVCHYFTAQACRSAGYHLIPEQGGYWMKRPHQGASKTRRAAELAARAMRQVRHRILPSA